MCPVLILTLHSSQLTTRGSRATASLGLGFPSVFLEICSPWFTGTSSDHVVHMQVDEVGGLVINTMESKIGWCSQDSVRFPPSTDCVVGIEGS